MNPLRTIILDLKNIFQLVYTIEIMKVVALVSGGKDSCFNIMHCLSNGHELVALANLYPPIDGDDELDSYMYQTVGHDILSLYSKCIGKPMYRQVISGKPENQNLEYKLTIQDETEDLYLLLKTVLENHPDVQGVSVGAILSSYQRTRVEDVCARLGLTSLAFLWQRDQGELMNEMCQSSMDARIIKVAAIGLDERHLGMTLKEIHPTLINLNSKFGVHICGEGGEFETSVFDAPFFVNGSIEITEREVVKHTNDNVWYLKMKVEFKEGKKEPIEDWSKLISAPPLLNEKFQYIDELVNVDVDDTVKAVMKKQDKCTWSEFMFDAGEKLFISNLYSNCESIEDQTVDIFSKLNKYLDDQKLTFTNIQSCKLLLGDMSNFGTVNSIYTKYFTNPLPPSRICVETNLPTGVDIQLSVVVIKDLKLKTGLHVQGRSYWAPSNIGPYSQCISFEGDLICRLSGQIPLIPASMVLDGSAKFNSILSLQHYDNVKVVTGYTKNLLTVCFIKNPSYVNLVNKVFDEYNEEGKSNIVIVQVSELPKSADVEWGGLAYRENDSLKYESDSEDEEPSAIERVRIKFVDSLAGVEFSDDTYYTIYNSVSGDETMPCGAEVVPVGGVWDSQGRKWGGCIIEQ